MTDQFETEGALKRIIEDDLGPDRVFGAVITVNALRSHAEFGSPLGANFKRLQEVRHWADYSIDPHPDTERATAGSRFTEAQQFVGLAKETIGFVDALAPDAKQRLAVLLVARSRR